MNDNINDTYMISIIVPVYNVENYLSNCVESIINQTYKNFEVILVDDGSSDNSPALCDYYAQKYTNITVIHKKNGGLSDARNIGTNIARAKYITYIDSDDYVHPMYLELLLKGIQRGAELSVCNYSEVYDGKNMRFISPKSINIKIQDAKKSLLDILYQRFHDVAAWGILLPTDLARTYTFPKGKLFEDLATTYKYYLHVNRVAFVDMKLYYYLQRTGSIMGQRDKIFVHDLIEISDLVVNDCKIYDHNIEKAAVNKQFSNYCRLIIQASNLEKDFPKEYQRIITRLKKIRLSVLMDNKARIKNRLAAFMLFFGVDYLKLAFRLK